jgi:hypothetical protein
VPITRSVAAEIIWSTHAALFADKKLECGMNFLLLSQQNKSLRIEYSSFITTAALIQKLSDARSRLYAIR